MAIMAIFARRFLISALPAVFSTAIAPPHALWHRFGGLVGTFSRSGYSPMALHFSTNQVPTKSDRTNDQILIEETKDTRTIVLNRPHQLNAISYWMTGLLKQFYQQWEDDDDIHMVLIKGSGRAFSAGGDVAEVYHFGNKGQYDKSLHFFSQEYNVVYTVGTYKKPHVALLNGIVMGGGAGLSMNGSFRVVSEKTVFAMPETGLGLHPDVGASYFLSHLPGYLGEYLGLTGARLDGTELLAIGLATHYVSSERLLQLEERLKSMGSGNPAIVSEAIDCLSEKVEFKNGSPLHRLSEIDACFSKSSVEEILGALECHQEGTNDDWFTSIITTLRRASPLSLKITLRSIREGRRQTLYECLIREYRMTVRCLLKNISNDFYEGCRAILVDKDKNPKWNPSSLESVTPAMVDHYFSPFEKLADELQLPGHHRKQTAIYKAHARL